jgi:hypothetical protein
MVTPGLRRAVAASALTLVGLCTGGCEPSSPLEAAGLGALAPSEGWRSEGPNTYSVPGKILAAWSGPEGASLVAYRNLPIPDPSASALAEELAARLANLPGMTVGAVETRRVGGAEAAWVESVGPGTGDALAPSGVGVPVAPEGRTLVPTRRVALGMPRADGTVWLVWHFPDSARERLAPQVEATLNQLSSSGR